MIRLRPVQLQDIKYFTQWWRDSDLIIVTSGDIAPLTDAQISSYFMDIIEPSTLAEALHFMIDSSGQTIGHISLQKRVANWWEIQIVIGDKKAQGKDYGPRAIRQLIDQAKRRGINQIYLEVRPENTRAIKAYRKVGFNQVGKATDTQNRLQSQLIRMELAR